MLPKGENDNRDWTITLLQAQITKLQQVIVTNNFFTFHTIRGASAGPSKVSTTKHENTPRGSSKGKQADSYTKIESRSVSKTVATRRRKLPPSLIHFGVDLRHTLNAKQSREYGDLQAKLVARTTVASKTIVPERSATRTSKSAPR